MVNRRTQPHAAVHGRHLPAPRAAVFRATPYPWNNHDWISRNAKDGLADACQLIEKHGY
jgi:hypothetical protein